MKAQQMGVYYLRVRNKLGDMLRWPPRGGRETGAALAEYVLLMGLIALIAIAAITAFGDGLRDRYAEIAATF
jgi:Flp pilus assembly pilin Flp